MIQPDTSVKSWAWLIIENEFATRSADLSAYVAKPATKIRRATRSLNRELTTFARLKSYSQYARMRKNILKEAYNEDFEDVPHSTGSSKDKVSTSHKSLFVSHADESTLSRTVYEKLVDGCRKASKHAQATTRATTSVNEKLRGTCTSKHVPEASKHVPEVMRATSTTDEKLPDECSEASQLGQEPVQSTSAKKRAFVRRNLTPLLDNVDNTNLLADRTRTVKTLEDVDDENNRESLSETTTELSTLRIANVTTGDSGIDDDSQDNSSTNNRENDVAVELSDVVETSNRNDRRIENSPTAVEASNGMIMSAGEGNAYVAIEKKDEEEAEQEEKEREEMDEKERRKEDIAEEGMEEEAIERKEMEEEAIEEEEMEEEGAMGEEEKETKEIEEEDIAEEWMEEEAIEEEQMEGEEKERKVIEEEDIAEKWMEEEAIEKEQMEGEEKERKVIEEEDIAEEWMEEEAIEEKEMEEEAMKKEEKERQEFEENDIAEEGIEEEAIEEEKEAIEEEVKERKEIKEIIEKEEENEEEKEQEETEEDTLQFEPNDELSKKKCQLIIKSTEIVMSKYTIIRKQGDDEEDEREERGECSEQNSPEHHVNRELEESEESGGKSPESRRVNQLKRMNLFCSGSDSDSSESDENLEETRNESLHNASRPSQIISDFSDSEYPSDSSSFCITDSDDSATAETPRRHNQGEEVSRKTLFTAKSIKDQIEKQDIVDASMPNARENGNASEDENEKEDIESSKESFSRTRENNEDERSKGKYLEPSQAKSLQYAFRNTSENSFDEKEINTYDENTQKRDPLELSSNGTIHDKSVLRPIELSDFVAREGLTPTCELSTITAKDIPTNSAGQEDDENIWLLEIPRSIITDPKLCGKTILIENGNIKIGDVNYEATLRHEKIVSCILRSNRKKARYKTVNIKPVCSVNIRRERAEVASFNVTRPPRSPSSVPFPKNLKVRNPLTTKTECRASTSKSTRRNIVKKKEKQQKAKKLKKGKWHIDNFISKSKKRRIDAS